jgi:hypothetical protein
MSSEFDMYLKAKEILLKKVQKLNSSFSFILVFKRNSGIVATLNGKTLTKENLASIKPTTQVEYRNLAILSNVAQDPAVQGKTPASANIFRKEIKEALEYFEPQATKQYDLNYDTRSIVGDNYNDINEKYYGNNHYEGPMLNTELTFLALLQGFLKVEKRNMELLIK